MFAPAVIGPLQIGLDAVRRERGAGRHRLAAAAPRPSHGAIRSALARLLRRAAAVLDAKPVGEAAR